MGGGRDSGEERGREEGGRGGGEEGGREEGGRERERDGRRQDQERREGRGRWEGKGEKINVHPVYSKAGVCVVLFPGPIRTPLRSSRPNTVVHSYFFSVRGQTEFHSFH